MLTSMPSKELRECLMYFTEELQKVQTPETFNCLNFALLGVASEIQKQYDTAAEHYIKSMHPKALQRYAVLHSNRLINQHTAVELQSLQEPPTSTPPKKKVRSKPQFNASNEATYLSFDEQNVLVKIYEAATREQNPRKLTIRELVQFFDLEEIVINEMLKNLQERRLLADANGITDKGIRVAQAIDGLNNRKIHWQQRPAVLTQKVLHDEKAKKIHSQDTLPTNKSAKLRLSANEK